MSADEPGGDAHDRQVDGRHGHQPCQQRQHRDQGDRPAHRRRPRREQQPRHQLDGGVTGGQTRAAGPAAPSHRRRRQRGQAGRRESALAPDTPRPRPTQLAGTGHPSEAGGQDDPPPDPPGDGVVEQRPDDHDPGHGCARHQQGVVHADPLTRAVCRPALVEWARTPRTRPATGRTTPAAPGTSPGGSRAAGPGRGGARHLAPCDRGRQPPARDRFRPGHVQGPGDVELAQLEQRLCQVVDLHGAPHLVGVEGGGRVECRPLVLAGRPPRAAVDQRRADQHGPRRRRRHPHLGHGLGPPVVGERRHRVVLAVRPPGAAVEDHVGRHVDKARPGRTGGERHRLTALDRHVPRAGALLLVGGVHDRIGARALDQRRHRGAVAHVDPGRPGLPERGGRRRPPAGGRGRGQCGAEVAGATRDQQPHCWPGRFSERSRGS